MYKLYANAMPFDTRDLSIMGFGIERSPCTNPVWIAVVDSFLLLHGIPLCDYNCNLFIIWLYCWSFGSVASFGVLWIKLIATFMYLPFGQHKHLAKHFPKVVIQVYILIVWQFLFPLIAYSRCCQSVILVILIWVCSSISLWLWLTFSWWLICWTPVHVLLIIWMFSGDLTGENLLPDFHLVTAFFFFCFLWFIQIF